MFCAPSSQHVPVPSYAPLPSMAMVLEDGTREWRLDGVLHRVDGPAIIDSDDTQMWYVFGKRHRLDGPAIMRADGSEEWWVDGNGITHCSAHQKMASIRNHIQTIAGAVQRHRPEPVGAGM